LIGRSHSENCLGLSPIVKLAIDTLEDSIVLPPRLTLNTIFGQYVPPEPAYRYFMGTWICCAIEGYWLNLLAWVPMVARARTKCCCVELGDSHIRRWSTGSRTAELEWAQLRLFVPFLENRAVT